MVSNIENFEKFIVKQIVNTVDYHPETDEYEINRIHISDDIITVIEDEGSRYGLKRGQIDHLISQVADNIKITPAIKLRYDSIDVTTLKIGQHLRINILHPEKGIHYIELLVTNKYHFYVLSSDIVGVRYGDELHALDITWNNGYYINFTVTHGSKKQPNRKIILRLGKLQSIEEYSPSVVHDILDSESSFTYEGIEANQGTKKVVDKSKNKQYFLWIPNKWKPITFSWREGDVQDEASAFIITDNEDAAEAAIAVNKAFRLPTEKKMVGTLMKILFECCKWKNAFNGVDNLKYIKSVKAGIAKRVVSDLGYKEWELISQPQIEFVYEYINIP